MIIPDTENVARAIFSPKMIVNGEIQPEAFRLRATIHEDYLPVMRMAFGSWVEDINRIPQRKNRKLYGFAEMSVGEIRHIHLKDVKYDVLKVSAEVIASHAGIFVSYKGKNIIGGNRLSSIDSDVEQDFMLLAVQRELVELAQKGLNKF